MNFNTNSRFHVTHHPKVFSKDGVLLKDYGEHSNLILSGGLASLEKTSIASCLSRMYVGTGSTPNFRAMIASNTVTAVNNKVIASKIAFYESDVNHEVRVEGIGGSTIVEYVSPTEVIVDKPLVIPEPSAFIVCYTARTALQEPLGYTSLFDGITEEVAGYAIDQVNPTDQRISLFATLKYVVPPEQVGERVREIGISSALYEQYGLFSRLVLPEAIVLEEGSYLSNKITLGFIVESNTISSMVTNLVGDETPTTHDSQMFVNPPSSIPFQYWSYVDNEWVLVTPDTINPLYEPSCKELNDFWVRVYGDDSVEELTSTSFEEVGFADPKDLSMYKITQPVGNQTTYLNLGTSVDSVFNKNFNIRFGYLGIAIPSEDTQTAYCGVYQPSTNTTASFATTKRDPYNPKNLICWGQGDGYSLPISGPTHISKVGNKVYSNGEYLGEVSGTPSFGHLPMILFAGLDADSALPAADPSEGYTFQTHGYANMYINGLTIIDPLSGDVQHHLIPVDANTSPRGVPSTVPYTTMFDTVTGTYLKREGGVEAFAYSGPTPIVPGVQGRKYDKDRLNVEYTGSEHRVSIRSVPPNGLSQVKELVFGNGQNIITRIRFQEAIVLDPGKKYSFSLHTDFKNRTTKLEIFTDIILSDNYEAYAVHPEYQFYKVCANENYLALSHSIRPYVSIFKKQGSVENWEELSLDSLSGTEFPNKGMILVGDLLFKQVLYESDLVTLKIVACLLTEYGGYQVSDIYTVVPLLTTQGEEVAYMDYVPEVNKFYYTKKSTGQIIGVNFIDNEFDETGVDSITLGSEGLRMYVDHDNNYIVALYYDTVTGTTKASYLTLGLTMLATYDFERVTSSTVATYCGSGSIILWMEDIKGICKLTLDTYTLSVYREWLSTNEVLTHKDCLVEFGMVKVSDGKYFSTGIGEHSKSLNVVEQWLDEYDQFGAVTTETKESGSTRLLSICKSNPAYFTNSEGETCVSFIGSDGILYTQSLIEVFKYDNDPDTGSYWERDKDSFRSLAEYTLKTDVPIDSSMDWVYEFTPFDACSGVGLVDSLGNMAMFYTVDQINKVYQVAWRTSAPISTDIPYNSRRTKIEKRGNQLYINNVWAGNAGSSDALDGQQIRLFGIHNTSSSTDLSISKEYFHGLQIWSDSTRTTTVLDFYPDTEVASFTTHVLKLTKLFNFQKGAIIPGVHSERCFIRNPHIAGCYFNTGLKTFPSMDYKITARLYTQTKYTDIHTSFDPGGGFLTWVVAKGSPMWFKTKLLGDPDVVNGVSVASSVPFWYTYERKGSNFVVTGELLGEQVIRSNVQDAQIGTSTSNMPIFPPVSTGAADMDVAGFTVWTDATRTTAVCNMLPVEVGSTKYSEIPAPSNCFWCTVRKIYIEATLPTSLIYREYAYNFARYIKNVHVTKRIDTQVALPPSADWRIGVKFDNFTSYGHLNSYMVRAGEHLVMCGVYKPTKAWTFERYNSTTLNYDAEVSAPNTEWKIFERKGSILQEINEGMVVKVSRTGVLDSHIGDGITFPNVYLFVNYIQGAMDCNVSGFTIWSDATRETMLCNLLPVAKGSTEYSDTPAPSHCFWCTVRGIYCVEEENTETMLYGGYGALEQEYLEDSTLQYPVVKYVPDYDRFISGADMSAKFITEWIITETDPILRIPTCLDASLEYDATVEVYDEEGVRLFTREVESYDSANLSFTLTPGRYVVTISGKFPRFIPYKFKDTTSVLTQLYKIHQLGSVGWTSFSRLSAFCTNLVSIKAGSCYLSEALDFSEFARTAISLASVDLSTITGKGASNLDYAFYENSSLTYLNLSNVITEDTLSMKFMVFSVVPGYSLDKIHDNRFTQESESNQWSCQGPSPTGFYRDAGYAYINNRSSNTTATEIQLTPAVPLPVGTVWVGYTLLYNEFLNWNNYNDPRDIKSHAQLITWPSKTHLTHRSVFQSVTGGEPTLGFKNYSGNYKPANAKFTDIRLHYPEVGADHSTPLADSGLILDNINTENVVMFRAAFGYCQHITQEYIDSKFEIAPLAVVDAMYISL